MVEAALAIPLAAVAAGVVNQVFVALMLEIPPSSLSPVVGVEEEAAAHQVRMVATVGRVAIR